MGKYFSEALRSRLTGGLAAALSLTSLAATAGPADKIYHPFVERGERELEFRAGWFEEDGVYERAFVIDLAYTPTERWKTELVVEYEGESGEGGEIEALEWENVFVFTEPGQYAFDVGLLAEYEHKLEDGDDEIKIGPLIQKEFPSVITNLNLLLERELGSGHEVELVYGWEAKWRGRSQLEFGLQGFGELGEINDLGEENVHRIGPALFGVRRLANGNKIAWDASVLGSIGSDGPDTQLRFEIEYEMY